MLKPGIKICCINSVDEAKTAVTFGASAIGLLAKMPGGPGPISDYIQPFIDVCSGVRTNGNLDKYKHKILSECFKGLTGKYNDEKNSCNNTGK